MRKHPAGRERQLTRRAAAAGTREARILAATGRCLYVDGMQITQITGDGQHVVTGYSPDHVAVNGVRYTASLILLPDALLPAWPVTDAAQLRPEDLRWIRERPPEILLLGTGSRQVFPARTVWRELRTEPWGIEIMDTAAACRTFNLIVAEGRTVAAALIIGS
jgi:uncharacterized protein